MTLETLRFTVHLDPGKAGGSEVLPAEVTFQDQLRAELEGARNHVDPTLPLHTTVLWCWASLTRQRLWVGPYQEFRQALQGVEKAAEPEAVDPTEEEPAASSSPSPLPTPEPVPTTGNVPPPTPGT